MSKGITSLPKDCRWRNLGVEKRHLKGETTSVCSKWEQVQDSRIPRKSMVVKRLQNEFTSRKRD